LGAAESSESGEEQQYEARAYPLASGASLQIFLLAFTFMFYLHVYIYVHHLTHVDCDVFTHTYIHLERQIDRAPARL
jgi:hypothetical protein